LGRNWIIVASFIVVLFGTFGARAVTAQMTAASGQAAIQSVDLTKSSIDVVFKITVRNIGVQPIDGINVTLGSEVKMDMSPGSPLQPGQQESWRASKLAAPHQLTQDYSVGSPYEVAVDFGYDDGSTSHLTQSVMCVEANARKTGVQVGDWAQYARASSGNGTATRNNGTITFSVNSVIDDVTVDFNMSDPANPEASGAYTVNVDTGDGNGTELFLAADLEAGDPLYDSTIFAGCTINDTVTREYAGQAVEVNRWSIRMYSNSSGVLYSADLDIYWIRSTGMFAEETVHVVWAWDNGTTRVSDQNIWLTGGPVIPEFPSLLVLPFLAVAMLAAVIVNKKTRENKISKRETALALARKDRSTPTILRLKIGKVKRLAEGVFAKKRPDGVIELYLAED
jgi:hypothetical protein